MATQFNNHKKILYNTYLKADRNAPEFTGQNENLRDHWDLFVKYKESKVGKERRGNNKENAAKKIYHHKMSPGGYKTSTPEWDIQEATMRAQGVVQKHMIGPSGQEI
jgi:hypothetical protein